MKVRRSAITAVAVLLVAAVSLSAQFVPLNARLSAMGGTFIMDDMNDVLRYAAYMDKYKDGGEATFGGAILGIKSVGDLLSFGVLANRGFMLNDTVVANSFYSTGPSTLTTGVPLIPRLNAQNVPHLLVGINLEMFTLGFDLFYEYASASRSNEATIATGTTKAEARARIKNPGGVASVLFGGDEIPTSIKIGLGFPGISGKNDNGTTTIEVKSDKGLFVNIGGETNLPAGDFRVSVGVDYNFESYAFKIDTVEPAARYFNNRLANYVGLEGVMFTDTKWGAQYGFRIDNIKRTTAADTTKNRWLIQTLSCGIENGWKSVWILDECYARGGLTFGMVTPIEYFKNIADERRTRGQTNYNPVVPTVGVGAVKGIATLDGTLNLNSWAGAIAGPAVGMVTLTVRF